MIHDVKRDELPIEIDLGSTTDRVKKDMEIKEHGMCIAMSSYPSFQGPID
jgi:hypothetical protein